jgi:putative ABC transport system permease protein
MDWRRTAGMSARMVVLLRLIYNVGFILFGLAAIIVIVNLLVIQIIERTPEVGTIRALGATTGFVQRLLISETVLLSLCGGLAGIIIGSALVFLLRLIRFQLDNQLLQTLFGGNVLYLTVSPSVALVCVLIAVLIGFLSSLYPVHLALRIQPARSLSVQ